MNDEPSQIGRLVEALGTVMQPEAVGPWLTVPNEAFEGLKPREVVERGAVDRIWRMVHPLSSGEAF